ncbi:Uncharacterised protein [Mycobacteroides abscessus subsp. abscessus]|nr:Uncharacterised protein [Mycobacteroides abscessus subsp. abscessus]
MVTPVTSIRRGVKGHSAQFAQKRFSTGLPSGTSSTVCIWYVTYHLRSVGAVAKA